MTKQNSYDHAAVLAAGTGELFGPDCAKLPKPNMLMFDRIVRVNEDGGKYGKGEIIAELDIHKDLWFFKCHFQGDPVMPGCLGLDSMWQLTGFFLTWMGNKGKGRALGAGEIKFSGQILPENKIVTYHIHIKRVINRKLILAIADGTVAVDGREVYTADSLRVGLFESTEGF